MISDNVVIVMYVPDLQRVRYGESNRLQPHKCLILLVIGFSLWLMTGTTSADNLSQGVRAYQDGKYELALRLLEPLAEEGQAEAQTILGEMYHFGNGVAEDDSKAFELFLAAAEQGNADAQYQLAGMYIYGFVKNAPELDLDQEAARWYIAAAVQNHAAAQYSLGLLLIAGTGVIQDSEEGMTWIRQSAELGHPPARDFLGEYPADSKTGVN